MSKTYQVSIFLENKVGNFKRVTTLLKQEGVDIQTMTLTDTASNWGILNLLVDKPKEAVEILISNDVSAALKEIVILEMTDHPGGLDDVLGKLADAGINFNNAYGRVTSLKESAYLVLDMPNDDETISQLIDSGLKPLNAEQSYAPTMSV